MKYAIYLIAVIVLSASCSSQAQDSPNYTRVNLEQWESSLEAADAEVQLVDVRTPKEYAAGYIPGAVNIDFYSPDFMQQMEKLDKEATLYIYCRSGGRSAKASKQLSSAGFTEIIELKVGYNGYSSRK